MTASTLHPYKGRLSSLVRALRDVRERNGGEPVLRDETKELIERLRNSIVTAQNDDLSEPKTEKRMRHIARQEAIEDAIDFLTEGYNPPTE